MIRRAFRYRLCPTAEQARALEQTAGVVRLIYNLALEQRRDFWQQFRSGTGKRLTAFTQGPQLTQLRAEFPWIAAEHSTPQTQALRDLDRAYEHFFRGSARYPTFRQRGVDDRFRFKGVDIRVEELPGRRARVRIPKLGFVRYRDTRPMRGRIVSVTISRDVLGWHISFACEIEHEAPANSLPSVGIDRGIANTVSLSTGEHFSTPATAELERRKKRAQRVLARRKRGSNRYAKQRRRVAQLSAKIARVRADWRHKTTTHIADRFGMVAIEALKVQNMAAKGCGKRGLNRSIHEQGWGLFATVLAYKLEERGGSLVKVNPAYTSRECSECGTIDKASRESQASFACRHCGFTAHADTNAAINILSRGTAGVEGRGCAPVEAQTSHDRLAA